MINHTPGPWHVAEEMDDDGYVLYSIEADGLPVADIYRKAEHEANARLIAAAPVLLQTLREFVAAYNDAMPVKYAEDADYMLARMRDIKDLATRAINEATGAVEGVGEDE